MDHNLQILADGYEPRVIQKALINEQAQSATHLAREVRQQLTVAGPVEHIAMVDTQLLVLAGRWVQSLVDGKERWRIDLGEGNDMMGGSSSRARVDG